MEKIPDAIIPIHITEELIQAWLDSFYPSTKTLATHTVVNLLPRYGYDALAKEGYDELLAIMSDHFVSFLQLKVIDMCPERILTGLRVLRN